MKPIVHPSHTVAQVCAVNKVYRYLEAVSPALCALADRYKGQKVLKADDTMTAKFSAEVAFVLGAFPETRLYQVYVKASCYSVHLVAKACEHYEKPGSEHTSCLYFEESTYFADIDGQKVAKAYAPRGKSEMFTVDGILAARERYALASKALDEAKAVLHPFEPRETPWK
jgi:hypothetical protein